MNKGQRDPLGPYSYVTHPSMENGDFNQIQWMLLLPCRATFSPHLQEAVMFSVLTSINDKRRQHISNMMAAQITRREPAEDADYTMCINSSSRRLFAMFLRYRSTSENTYSDLLIRNVDSS
jgi:hypothetical protein